MSSPVLLDRYLYQVNNVTVKHYLDKLPAPFNHPVAIVGALLAALWVNWFIGYVRVRLEVLGLPTTHSWIELFESGFRSKVPNIPFICPNKALTLEEPWKKYADQKTDLLAHTQVTTPYAVYATSNPTVAAAVTMNGKTYLKPTGMFRYQAINIFGLQIVSTQTGAEHKRHKNVVKGCFGEGIMEIAWGRMVDAYQVMIKEENLANGGVLKDTKVAMIKATLLVIGWASFGVTFPWNIPKTDGPLLPFGEALEAVEMSMIPQLLLPLWFMTYSPFKYLRRCAKAQRSLVWHLTDLIAKREKVIRAQQAVAAPGEKLLTGQGDILGALIASQMDVENETPKEKGGKSVGLTPEEIFGNAWIFIVSGHETTGHTVTFTLALLALYPDVQEKIFEEVNAVCGGEYPNYRDMNSLPYTLASVYESLRVRDEVMFIPKLVAEDTLIPYTTWDDKGVVTQHQRLIKAGSHVIVDSPACSINPFYWDDPHTYNPSRHIGPDGTLQVKEGFTGFSSGSRVCIGKRFAEVESVALLSHLIKEYTFKPAPVKVGETWEEMRARLWQGTEELNLMPGKFGLKLEKRSGRA